MKKLLEMLLCLINERFWGEVNIKFQDGKPVMFTKEQQIKID